MANNGNGNGNGTGLQIPAPHPGDEVNNLPIQVSIAVPSTRGADEIADRHFENRVEHTRKWMDERFGGDTTMRGSGGYVTDAGELIEEDVAIVEASMSKESYMAHRKDFARFVEKKQRNWDQDSILYQVEGRVFIYPQREFIDDDLEVARRLIRVT